MDGFDLKKIRLSMGLTQGQFAKQVQITQGAFAKLEAGRLSITKYDKQLRKFIDNWKKSKIDQLEKEIILIKSL